MEIIVALVFIFSWIYGLYRLFKKPKPKKISITDFPNKRAKHFGKTFNDWRKLKGYKLEKYSVPDSELYIYCNDCGWPTKSEWSKLFNLPSTYLDSYQYNLWLNFIGVIDPDRSPNEVLKMYSKEVSQ